jgi:hypothetical protein
LDIHCFAMGVHDSPGFLFFVYFVCFVVKGLSFVDGFLCNGESGLRNEEKCFRSEKGVLVAKILSRRGRQSPRSQKHCSDSRKCCLSLQEDLQNVKDNLQRSKEDCLSRSMGCFSALTIVFVALTIVFASLKIFKAIKTIVFEPEKIFSWPKRPTLRR